MIDWFNAALLIYIALVLYVSRHEKKSEDVGPSSASMFYDEGFHHRFEEVEEVKPKKESSVWWEI